jgi:uncharacterized protein (TIGR03437 family)
MRLSNAAILPLLISCSAFGQVYNIQTFAGGGLPVNIPGTSAVLNLGTSVAADGAGNLFLGNQNVVLRLDAKTNALTVVAGTGTPGYSGDGGPATSAQLNGPAGVAVDAAGNLYITDAGNSCIRMVSNGVITTVAGNGTRGPSPDNGPATDVELNQPSGIAVDPAGNLYFVDSGDGALLKVSNGILTSLGGLWLPYPPTSMGHLYTGVALDAAGNLYIADTGSGRILEVLNGVLTLAAGTAMPGYSGDNGPATSAQLNGPSGVAVDAAGNLYIADAGNNRIRKVSNGVITTVAGSGTAGYSGDNGPAADAQLNQPGGIAVDGAGNLYIADSGNNRIRKVSNGVITTVAGGGSALGDNGPAAGAQLDGPAGVAADTAGDLYIADAANNRVRKVSNGAITTVAGNGGLGFSGDNGPATSAQLAAPGGVAVDAAGNLYIADTANNRIRKVSNGAITTVAGGGSALGDNGPAASAQLVLPTGLAVDGAGNLYIADTGNNRIREVSNGVITTVAGGGSGTLGDNGPAIGAELNNPNGIAVDAAGNLYIADTGNNGIRKVSGGVITSVAGNLTAGYTGGSVPAAGAPLNQPSGVAVDGAGNLYIADTLNRRIRKVSNGVIATIAGNGTQGYSGDDGVAISAELNDPNGLAVDAAGKVYVADTDNLRIRVLTPFGSSCPVSISPPAVSAGASGGSLTLAISTGSSCGWTVESLASWITVPGTVAGVGPGNVALVVGANAGAPRTGTVSIAGVSVQVNQDPAPCTYALIEAGQDFASAGGTNNVPVSTSSWCSWSASSTLSWVALTGGASGTGDGSVAFQVLPNNGLARNGNLTVAGLSFSVSQAGAVPSGPSYIINTFAGNGTPVYSCFGGATTGGEFGGPAGIALDGAGNLYLGDTSAGCVREVSNGVITNVAGGGKWLGDNGPATSAGLVWPEGVAVDSAGNLYIADNGHYRIRKVSNGIITTVAGNGAYGYSGDNGLATSAEFESVYGVAADSAGNLYISDSWSGRVSKVSNGVITTVAGGGPSFGDNGPATSAQVGPEGIAVDAAGNLYIADAGNNRIRKVSNGVITTVAGGGSSLGDNGPATSAQLSQPSGVAVDSAGNLYIVDSGQYRIRKVSNGVITTVAGDGTYGSFLGDNGPATSAQFRFGSLNGIAVDAAGNVYFSDVYRVRILTPTTGPTIIAVQNGASFLPGLAPDAWFTINGVNLAFVGSDSWQNGVVNGQLPTALDGVSVTVGGQPAYVDFVSPAQINAVAPDIPAGPTTVVVTNSMGASAAFSITAQTYAPAFFLWPGGYAVATHEDYSDAARNGALAGLTTAPARPGEVVILWGTGFGPTSPAAPAGAEVPVGFFPTASPVSVTVGDLPATVYGAALAPGFAGLYQVAIQIPPSLRSGDWPVVATVNGVASPDSTLISVQSAGEELLTNGVFTQELLDGWAPDVGYVAFPVQPPYPGQPPYPFVASDPPYSNVLEITSTEAIGFDAYSIVSQLVNVPAANYSSLVLSGVVKAVSADVANGCGETGTEFPIQFQVAYKDSGGVDRTLVFGFYFGSGSCGSPTPPDATWVYQTISVPQNQWTTFISPNLKNWIGDGSRITQINIVGNGWDYDGEAANVSLTGQ